MNDASRWRIELARTLTPRYASHDQVTMMVLGGSPSRALSDAYSDLDMVVYWREGDADWIRAEPLRGLPCERAAMMMGDDGEGLESYKFGTLKVDVGHITERTWEEMTDAVLKRHETGPDLQQSLAGFAASVPLWGEDRIATWKERIAVYPEPLATRVVRENLRFFVKGYLLNQCWRRGEVLAWYDGNCQMLKTLLTILAALNRAYFSAAEPRWVEQALDGWEIKPSHCWSRVKRVLESEGDTSDQALEALLEDVFGLVRQHMPDIDLSRIPVRRESLGVTGCPEPPDLSA